MILTPEQEQQVQRILDTAERAVSLWEAAAHRANVLAEQQKVALEAAMDGAYNPHVSDLEALLRGPVGYAESTIPGV